MGGAEKQKQVSPLRREERAFGRDDTAWVFGEKQKQIPFGNDKPKGNGS